MVEDYLRVKDGELTYDFDAVWARLTEILYERTKDIMKEIEDEESRNALLKKDEPFEKQNL